MGLDELSLIEGQTPIALDERKGLRIKTISNIEELNEFEQFNIEKAIEWSLAKNFSIDTILDISFVNNVHKKMFGEVWLWAGEFRQTNKNIGADKLQIGAKLLNLIRDCKFWVKNKTYEPDEIAIRFKHRTVSIHCYPNGNGRHSRLMADILITHIFNRRPFSWGNSNLVKEDQNRKSYLNAIRKADEGDMSLLLKFARS